MQSKKYIYMTLANYIPVLFVCLFFRFPIILLTYLLMPIVLACCNYKFADKKSQLVFLDVNLLISTIAANRIHTYLFLHYVSNDAESEIIGMGLLVFVMILVLVSFLISILLFIAKQVQNKKRTFSDEGSASME